MNKAYDIYTEVLGNLHITIEDGLFKNYMIMLDGEEVFFDLYVWENLISSKNIEVIKAYINCIPLMYEKAKQTFLTAYETDPTIQYYIQFHLEELDADAIHASCHLSSQEIVTPEIFLNALRPTMISIAENANTVIDCTMDFCIDREISDELLVARFNPEFEIYNISHES